ncbi:MAG TPA: hypothetical protein VLU47_09660 [Blastocatellia bacterium]|nr:hypothetical protein [Blastocatellia bacterium]
MKRQYKARTGGVPYAGEQARRTCPRSLFLPALIVLLAAFTSSCKPFNVKPNIEVPRAPNESQVESNGVVIRGSVVDDEDWLSDTFDANLLLAGVIPVRIELRNAGQAPIELSRVRFEIKTIDGQNFRSTGPERAFKRALSYYGVSAWSKGLYKESRADFASYAIDLKAPLAPGASRQGLLYFLLRGEAASGGSHTLVISRLRSSDSGDSGRVELKLNTWTRVD